VFNLDSSYKVYDGELVVFFGDTKLGKSMILQNIIVAYPNYKFLLLSLENGKILDSRRMLQIAHGLSKEAVMEYYQDGKKGLAEAISHVKFIDTSVHINELGKIVAQSECDIVCIDTVDQLGTDTHQDNYTGRTEELTMKLRELTRNTKKTVIVIHHISKHSSENEKGQSKPLTIHSGKGSSALEQKADKVIGIEGEREGIIRTIRSLGARDEMEFITQLKFNKVTFKLEK
jgi:RecA-family ATPase